MSDAAVIYPHQLCLSSPVIAKAKRDGLPVYLIEEPLILTHNPIHIQKLIFHKLSLDSFATELAATGLTVVRVAIKEQPTTASVFTYLKNQGVTILHVADTTDRYLETALTESGLDRVWYESPIFILSRDDAVDRYEQSGRRLAHFYKQLRRDRNVLIETDGTPTGGAWSFDADNRKRIPAKTPLPEDITMESSPAITAATDWATAVGATTYGEPGCWLPYTRATAKEYLEVFLRRRFHDFGPYEDAIHTDHVRLWHSGLSPLLNVGLLTPEEVLEAVLTYGQNKAVPIQSLEGFVRQLLGWREFIRASYEADGSYMRTKNFFNHHRPLPSSFWTGTTGVLPVDHSITNALRFGYNHHIERLMVLGNFMLLCQIDPDEVYAWFIGMYLDAYDWVMVPNVYGMSQFADGGRFATKPYISGSNYLRKMSNIAPGDWEATWTALYWQFIAEHQAFFKSNHRLSMMPRLWEKMPPETQMAHQDRATTFLQTLT